MYVAKCFKKNAFYSIIKSIFSIVFPLITFPYVSRILRPENIGKVNFGSSFVSYFALIATLGLTTYAIRECSKVREDRALLSRIASQLYSINICTTIVAYVLLAVTLIIFKNLSSYKYIIIVQSTSILLTTLGADWINLAMEDLKFITIRTVLFCFISLGLMLIFVKKPDDYIKYAIIAVLATGGANVVNIIYRKRYCKLSFLLHMDLKCHMKPILFLFVMNLSQRIFNNSDITMIGLIKGNYEVGIYSSAVKIRLIITQLVSSLLWVVMPKLSVCFSENNYEEISKTLSGVFNILVTLGFPCVVGSICLSKEIINIIAGADYQSASSVLIILMIGTIFDIIGGSFLGNMVLLPSGKERIYMRVCCLSTIVNLILNAFFIPLWGANGAAFTTIVSFFLVLVLLIHKRDKQIHLKNVWRTISISCVGCVVIFFVCLLVKIVLSNIAVILITSIFFSVLAYFLTQILFKNDIAIEIISFFTKRIKNEVR